MTAFAIMGGTNADMIVACNQLGYIHESDLTLDVTFGQGRWWSKWRPGQLVTNDINRYTLADLHYDFQHLPPEWTDTFDVVAYDPPYKLNGTGGSHPSDKGYGVDGTYTSIADKHELIMAGVRQCARVVKPGGVLLIKCQDQVSSGKVRWQTFMIYEYLTPHVHRPCELIDLLHLEGYRAQPEGRRQVHARRNYSTLMVFKRRTL